MQQHIKTFSKSFIFYSNLENVKSNISAHITTLIFVTFFHCFSICFGSFSFKEQNYWMQVNILAVITCQHINKNNINTKKQLIPL